MGATSKTTRILIAVQKPIERLGLYTLLINEEGLSVIGVADNRKDVVRLTRTTKPDIILITLHIAGSEPVEFVNSLHLRLLPTQLQEDSLQTLDGGVVLNEHSFAKVSSAIPLTTKPNFEICQE